MLRRDGFVSLEGTGTVTTPPIRFTGRHLFLNAKADRGEVAVEVMGESVFAAGECVPVRADSTRQAVRWQLRRDLSRLVGKPLRLRFHLTRAQI